jgi:hypothetical protein
MLPAVLLLQLCQHQAVKCCTAAGTAAVAGTLLTRALHLLHLLFFSTCVQCYQATSSLAAFLARQALNRCQLWIFQITCCRGSCQLNWLHCRQPSRYVPMYTSRGGGGHIGGRLGSWQASLMNL